MTPRKKMEIAPLDRWKLIHWIKSRLILGVSPFPPCESQETVCFRLKYFPYTPYQGSPIHWGGRGRPSKIADFKFTVPFSLDLNEQFPFFSGGSLSFSHINMSSFFAIFYYFDVLLRKITFHKWPFLPFLLQRRTIYFPSCRNLNPCAHVLATSYKPFSPIWGFSKINREKDSNQELINREAT